MRRCGIAVPQRQPEKPTAQQPFEQHKQRERQQKQDKAMPHAPRFERQRHHLAIRRNAVSLRELRGVVIHKQFKRIGRNGH